MLLACLENKTKKQVLRLRPRICQAKRGPDSFGVVFAQDDDAHETGFSLSVILSMILCTALAAMGQTVLKQDQAVIARVKNTEVSQLQPGMPKAALEYYLQTQSGKGVKITWEMNDCGEQTGDPADRNINDPPICVEADITNTHGDSAFLFIAVGSAKTGIKGKPKVFSISFKDAQGNTKELRRIGQIPLEFENASGS